MIHIWKRALLEVASGLYERGGKIAPEIDEEQVKELHAKIGELTVASDFFQKAQAVDRKVRRKMIETAIRDLSIGKQCRLLSISQSSFLLPAQGRDLFD